MYRILAIISVYQMIFDALLIVFLDAFEQMFIRMLNVVLT
jgi:hypothetical protein